MLLFFFVARFVHLQPTVQQMQSVIFEKKKKKTNFFKCLTDPERTYCEYVGHYTHSNGVFASLKHYKSDRCVVRIHVLNFK